MARRRSFPRRQVAARWSSFLRTNWRRLSVFAGIVIAGVVPLTLAVEGYWRGLVHGAVLVGMAAAIGLLFVLHTGAAPALAGAWGEDNTRDDLRWAAGRGHIWGWVDNLEIEGGDVDHLVLAPAGVFALDSKWRARPLSPDEAGAAAQAAQRAARRASLVLRSLHQPPTVRAAIVLWGGAHRLQPAVTPVDGVDIVPGHQLRQWLQDLAVGQLEEPDAHRRLRQLADFRTRVDPERRRPMP